MTTSIRTTERIPITKTPPKTELGMTINWNNSLVKHWGIFPPQTKPGKPGRHSSVVTVSDTIYPTDNDTRYSRRCHRLGTCIPAFFAT